MTLFHLMLLPPPGLALQGEEGEELAGSRERFPPGRIVWARVEGHEFWPARVVRRRAGACATSAFSCTACLSACLLLRLLSLGNCCCRWAIG